LHHQAPAQGVVKAAAVLALWAALGAGGAAPSDSLIPLDEAGFQKLLASQRGKVVLFDFWATWCEPCREELPSLARLSSALRERGLVLITVSADEPEQEKDALGLLRRTSVSGAAYVKRARSDEDFINFIDPKWSGALPALFLYDRAGRRAATFIGETEPSTVEAAVRKLL
jgi:thiol-disulfide isomerase/thioredoxin